MKRKKRYCKNCFWRDSETECRVFERIDDHDAPDHKVLLHSFKTREQNRHNNCVWFRFSLWSLVP